MQIEYLYLSGFRPLSLSNIREFVYRPGLPIQVILGGNGSGKSSLLRALTPTVTDSDEFDENGSKVIHLTDNGSRYELESHYGKSSSKHSFKVDGEELNVGGTGRVQNELVATHLNYTRYLHTILTGKMNFCEMGPNQREGLLMRISGVDIEYVTGLYEYMRGRLRDTTGAIKHLGSKYHDLATRIAAMGDVSPLMDELTATEQELERLLPYTNWSMAPASKFRSELQTIETQLEAAVREAIQTRNRIRDYREDQIIERSQFPTMAGFRKSLTEIQYRQIELHTRIRELNVELGEVADIKRRLDECPDSIDLSHLETAIAELTAQVDGFTLRTLGAYSNADEAHRELLRLFNDFGSFCDTIPHNQVTYTPEEIGQIKGDYQAVVLQINHGEVELGRLKERKHHADLARDGDVTCPNCNHHILSHNSLNPQTYQTLVNEIEQLEHQLATWKVTRDERQRMRDSVVTYESLEGALRRLAGSYTAAMAVWRKHGRASDVIRAPQAMLEALRIELGAIEEWQAHLEQKAQLEKYKEYQYLILLSQNDGTMVRYQELEKELNELHVALSNAETALQVFGRLDKLFQQQETQLAKIDQLMQRRAKAIVEWSNAEGTEAVNTYVREGQRRVGSLRHTLSTWQDLVSRREQLETEEKELKDAKEELKLIVDSLSPNTGVIAEQLRMAVNNFVGRVNRVLEEIWVHDLYLSVPEGNNIDFKFHLHVDGAVRKEIKKGSTGEQDVINLAVCLVVMQQHGLQGYPLFLDEVGSTFDMAHRRHFIEFIRELVATGQVAQVFMISHFAESYGALSHADIIALNTRNIQIDGKYNEVVTIR